LFAPWAPAQRPRGGTSGRREAGHGAELADEVRLVAVAQGGRQLGGRGAVARGERLHRRLETAHTQPGLGVEAGGLAELQFEAAVAQATRAHGRPHRGRLPQQPRERAGLPHHGWSSRQQPGLEQGEPRVHGRGLHQPLAQPPRLGAQQGLQRHVAAGDGVRVQAEQPLRGARQQRGTHAGRAGVQALEVGRGARAREHCIRQRFTLRVVA
jgi:hypothetical protein